MNIERFLEQFELLADIPNAVPKLRELILELAVRGKLVPQDPNDEPAHSKSISTKIHDKEPDCQSSDVPDSHFRLPVNWQWTCIAQVSDLVQYGYTASASYSIKEPLFLRITDIQGSQVNWATVPGCDIKKDDVEIYSLNEGDLLVARTGGTIGKSFLIGKVDKKAVFASYLIRIVPSTNIIPRYLKVFADSPLYWKQLYARSAGTGQPNVNGTSLKTLALPLPPLTEQHRIIAKVDQLMAICDDLERYQQERRENRQRLYTAALDALNTAKDADGVAEAWNRVYENFDLMFDVPESVGKIRATVLELAVRGKLVPQDPNDEPAGVILTAMLANAKFSISDEYDRLHERKQKDIISRYYDGMSWCLPKMKNVFKFIDYRGRTPVKVSNGIRLITAKNVRMGSVQLEPAEFIAASDYQAWMTRGFPRQGDILFTTEAPLGNVAQLNVELPVALAQRVINLQPLADISTSYLKYALMSPYMQWLIAKSATGTTAKGIKSSKLKNITIPFPPLAEQHRIVAKVDQLMALCDDLEEKLKRAQEDGKRLMDAIVASMAVSTGAGKTATTAASREVAPRTPKAELPAVGPAPVAEPKSTNGAHPARKPARRRSSGGVSVHRAQPSLFDLLEEEPKKPVQQVEERPEHEFMAAFRRAARGAGALSEDDLLREAALALGHGKPGEELLAMLRRHLRTAVRRKILGREGERYRLLAPTIAGYEEEFLLKSLRSGMERGYEYQPRDLAELLAERLGYASVTEALEERVQDIIRRGKKEGELEAQGNWIWRKD